MLTSKKQPKLLNPLELARASIESGKYRHSYHAKQRHRERDITFTDALYVIKNGHRVPKRDKYVEEWASWNYVVEGTTLQDEKLRVVISFDEDLMLIITVIKLGV